MKPIGRYLLLLLLLGHMGWAQAAPLLLRAEGGPTLAAGHLQRLDDPAGFLVPQQAVATDGWTALPSSLSAGFTHSYIWLRVAVVAPDEGVQRWMLRLSNALLDDVRLYQRDAQGRWQEQRAGEELARGQWPIDYHSPAFSIALQGGRPEVLLIRLHSKNALSTSLDFSPGRDFAESSRSEYLGYGLYFGIFLMLLGFHSVFWRLTRVPGSGWYLSYVGCIVACDALTIGLPQQMLGMPVWLSDPLLGVVIALGLPVGIIFADRHLALGRVYPRLLTSLLWLCGLISGGAILAFLLPGYFRVAMPVVQATTLLTFPLLIGLALWLLWRGHRPALFYLLAFGVFYLGVTVSYLRNLGYLPANFWTDHATAVGSMLHMGVMSLRITSHYNTLKRDKERAQAQTTELMQQQNARLEALVQARTCELSAALLQEQHMREEQNDFVAMVSHEFRTPLAIIRASAQQLARQLDAPLEKNQRRCQNIGDAGARLLALVDDYLTHDRMADAQPTSRFVACDLVALLDGLVADFPDTRIAFDHRLADGSYWCDSGLLHVAVRNLLANADRHAPAAATVQLQVWEAGERICLEVRHPGSLIAEDERERLFHKYYRGRQAHVSAGAGLGLYMVRRIAELHGGVVELAGYGGEEAICFRLSLRLSRPPAEREALSVALQPL